MDWNLLTRSKNKDICRDLARSAAVSAVFAVFPDSRKHADHRRTTASITEAAEFLQNETGGTMRIMFEWRLGNRFGNSEIEYEKLSHPLATENFVRQTTENMITEKIADILYHEHYR
jgi:hypothetical protein